MIRRSATAAPAVGQFTLSAIGLALTATVAHAGGVPLDVPLGTTQPDTRFTLAGPADYQDLHFYAAVGQDAWFGMGEASGDGSVVGAQVLDPSGKPLASFGAGDPGGKGYGEAGVELHPTVSGTYTVRVTPGDAYDEFPVSVYAWYWPDCRGGPATQCTIAPGKTKASQWGGYNDGDSFIIKAPAGRRYAVTLTITSGQYKALLSVWNKSGKVLVSGVTGLGQASRFTRPLTFTLPSSGGPYYVKAQATWASGAGHV